MDDASLLLLCAVAFAAVLLTLGALAGLIEGLVRVFPASPTVPTTSAATASVDTAPVIAAIHGAVRAQLPHLSVTRIEERQDL